MSDLKIIDLQTQTNFSDIAYTQDEVNAILPIIAETDTNIYAGQPLYSKTTGHFGLAKADNALTTIVAGLAKSGAISNNVATCLNSTYLTLVDWTQVIGTANLTAGNIYYLDATSAGKLTSTAPTATGKYVAPVGQAVTANTLNINIQPSILL